MSQLDGTTPQHSILYLNTGVGVFGGIGNPNGVERGGIGSEYTDFLTGDRYNKTTAFELLTGWVLAGGGGGGGSVTNFSAADLSPLFTTNVANPTTTPALTFSAISQAANLVYASPNGAPGLPAFRALTNADLALAAAPPTNGIQYNDGTNALTASNGFRVDPATNTLQVGELGVLKGTLQLQSQSGGGSHKITVGSPSSNIVNSLPDALPNVNDLLRASAVSGSNVTWGYVAPSALGFVNANPTNNVLPYNNAGSFADSPLTRISATSLTSAANLTIPDGVAATPSLRFTTNNTGFFGSGFNVGVVRAGIQVANLGNDIQIAGQYLVNNSVTSSSNLAGLTWLAAGVARISNGSTGAGQLAIGSSPASTANQFLVDSQLTTRIAGFFSMPNGSNVPTIQGVTNGIQSFAFEPGGRIIGGCNIPTATQQFSALGNAKSDVSTIGNVGAGVDNLLAFVIPANAINNTGDYVEFDAFGEFAANANNKTLKVVYGATTIFNTGAIAFSASNWRINVKILRTGASAGKSIATFWSNEVLTPFLQEIFITTESFTANKTIQFTGEATSNDDITQLHLESKITIALTS